MGVHADIKLVDQDDEGVDLAFRADVLNGLAQRQKAIPARWFYDRAGSELFERITALPGLTSAQGDTVAARLAS